MDDKNWSFELGQLVHLSRSKEEGEVVGRAEYTNCTDSYLVRYVAGDGRQVESWISEDALAA